MHSEKPKVLHTALGKALIDHVIDTAEESGATEIVVVVGHGKEQVIEHLGSRSHVTIAVQDIQNGTGHAASVALAALSKSAAGAVLVLSGDAPLITATDLTKLFAAQSGKSAALLTAHLLDPSGYGRIIRAEDESVSRIVEHRDATEIELALTEVNSGTYCFDLEELRKCLTAVDSKNSQGEIYLTDVIALMHDQGGKVVALETDSANILGVNDRKQLADVIAILRQRILSKFMLAGVTIEDPATTWIESEVAIAPDATLQSNVRLTGKTSIASGAVIGPDCTLADTKVFADAKVFKTTAIEAVIGNRALVGPYTYLRPGTVLGDDAKAGGFVEMKNATLGAGAKVPHLSYVGDAEIGEGSNIGAATIFVNYDGVEKHKTIVGKHVRIGSDTMLVAPVTIGDGAYTAAGSVITEDVPAGAIGVGRSRQRNILDWVLRRRPGSDSAKAAVADSDKKNS